MLSSTTISAYQTSRDLIVTPEQQDPFLCIATDFNQQPILQVHLLYHNPPRPMPVAEFDPDVNSVIMNVSFAPTVSLKTFINENGISWNTVTNVCLQLKDTENNTKIWRQDYGLENRLYQASIIIPGHMVSELVNVLLNKPSTLHIEIGLEFKPNGQYRKLTALFPLRRVLGEIVKQALSANPYKFIHQQYLRTSDLRFIEYHPTVRERVTSGRTVPVKPTKMVHQKGKWTPLAGMNTTLTTVPLQPALIAQATYLPSAKLWNYGLIVANEQQLPSKDIPLLTENDGLIWPDISIKDQYWYLPSVQLLLPAADEPIDQSPFHLNFLRKGAGQDGMPILEGSLTLTVQFYKPTSVSEHAKSRPSATYKAIPITNKSFSILLPIMDPEGNLQTSLLQPTSVIETNSLIKLVFTLTNPWTRACYGVLSIEGFQTSKAVLAANLGFKAMRKRLASQSKPLQPLSIGKLSLMKTNSAFRSMIFKQVSPLKKVLANQIDVSVKPLPKDDDMFTLETFSRQQQTELFIPCSSYGSYFTEQSTGDIPVSIGCHEPYRLGEIKFQLYESVTALAHPNYSIHRSLQSPGQYMIVPTTYRIGRFESTHPQFAGRPCIHLYGALDEADQFQQSKAYFTITLQPDISAMEWYKLREQLKMLSPETPQLFFPGEIASSSVFRWNLPSGVTVETLAAARDVSATFSMDVMQVLALQGMIEQGNFLGIGTYTLPDGKNYTVNLQPDTSRICGPWLEGPLSVIIEGKNIQFRNSIEKEIQISGIIGLNNKGEKIIELPLQLLLKPGEFNSVQMNMILDTVIADVNSSTSPSPIDETWVFVDDVEAEVLFQTDFDFTSYQISGLTIAFTLPPLYATEETIVLNAEQPSAEKPFFIPLTQLSKPREINYRFRAVGTRGESQWSNWLKQDLATEGSLIWIKSQQVLSLFTT